jgi:Zn finger protein HypA/HybF involved in hydrogenase expression
MGRCVGVDRSGEARFECLRCGKASGIARIEAPRPRCSVCGSGSGVLGDIGQGSAQDRLRRASAASPAVHDNVNFECLRCGTVTGVGKMDVLQPACLHCGSKDGVVVDVG